MRYEYDLLNQSGNLFCRKCDKFSLNFNHKGTNRVDNETDFRKESGAIKKLLTHEKKCNK